MSDERRRTLGRARDQGSLVANTSLTWDEFKVDLQQLRDAIGIVSREHDTIHETMGKIGTEFEAVKDSWHTPSRFTYDDFQQWFMQAAADLESLLQDMIGRMWQAYNNYHAAEETNTENNNGHHHGSGGGSTRLAGNQGPNGGDPATLRRKLAALAVASMTARLDREVGPPAAG